MFSRDRKTPIAEWWWTVDKGLLAALVLLMLTGIVLSFAASPPVAERLGLGPWHFIIRQAIFAVLALPVLIGTSFLPPRAARFAALGVLVVSVVLLWLTLRFGTEVKGAKRWISAFGQIHPALRIRQARLRRDRRLAVRREHEAEGGARPHHRDRDHAGDRRGLLLQPDIGQTALVLATWAGLLFLSGISWFIIFGLLGRRGRHAVRRLHVLPALRQAHRRLHQSRGGCRPRHLPDREGPAVAAGGRLVRAWAGRVAGQEADPDAHADYIFSAAAGEFGILFCLVLVALIAYIVIRALIGAQRQQNLFARLAASTLAIQFGLQCSINLAVNLNLMPPKGMTLPFVSYGGTSMIAVAFGMGLMLALTRKKPEERLATGLPLYRTPVLSPAE
jgi:cell division protein FtsW